MGPKNKVKRHYHPAPFTGTASKIEGIVVTDVEILIFFFFRKKNGEFHRHQLGVAFHSDLQPARSFFIIFNVRFLFLFY